MTTQTKQTLGFEAEVSQLLDLVAKSLYSNKEIFLRELISNASDAADKLRYQALTDDALYEGDAELAITISVDEAAKTLTISDNGIGMTRDDAINHLGTIAQSGTRAFRELLSQEEANESQLIGQFGVGFYSAFIVSDNVVVRSRKAGVDASEGVEWQSAGKGDFTVDTITREARGTEIILHLKDDEKEFLEPARIKNIINKYSDHILLPIKMGDEVVNSAKALWTQPKGTIKDEDYQQLYKHISHDFEDALTWAHNKVEGSLEYTSLLYIPSRAPFDLWMREQRRGLKLFVKRVFIMDDADQFLPMYMRFVKGVIDSNDLPLNISRELLQSNQMIDRMRSACVKRVLDLLEKMAEQDPDAYAKFWSAFGEVMKEGPAEDFANKDRIAGLLRFSSTHDDLDVQATSFAQYVARMPEGQKGIYYITADSFAAAKNSPLLEVFRKKNIEVLLLFNKVDEWLMNSLPEFEGKPLMSVSKGALDLGDLDDEQDKAEQSAQAADFDAVIEKIKTALGDRVKEVRLTHRLTDSPACIVCDDNDMSNQMQRLLQSAGQVVDRPVPILELNPSHPVLERVKQDIDTDRLARWSEVLLSQALIAEGEQLDDPAAFVKEMNQLLVNG